MGEHGNKSCYEERKGAAGAGEQNTGEEEKEPAKRKRRSCSKNATMKHSFFVCGYKNKAKERLVHLQRQPDILGQLALQRELCL